MNYVYMLRCADNTLYSGWTNALTQRLTAHNCSMRGAKYTRTRRPVTLVHCEAFATQGEAMRREVELKAMTRAQKEALLAHTAAMEEEHLDVVDTQGVVRGALPRALVHRCGLRHRVVYLLVCQNKGTQAGIWLQQRALDRPTSAGKYDWTATGHIGAGEAPCMGVLREAQEEVGLVLAPQQIVQVAQTHRRVQRDIYAVDDEIAYSFLHIAKQTPSFEPGQEVTRMAWVSIREMERAYRTQNALTLHLLDGKQEQVEIDAISRTRSEWNRVKAACLHACKALQER